MDVGVDALIESGRQALAACDWETARSSFELAGASVDTPEVVDGLGQSLYWLGDYQRALPLRERAFGLHEQAGDRRAAAGVAIQLAVLHGLIFDNGAAVSGWLGHARRLLADEEEGPEHGWVELFLAVVTDDPDERQRRARRAMALGRRFGHPGLEFDALGYIGKAMVERGEVAAGMALIDQAVAAVTSGMVTDPWAAGEIYCTLFHACELTIDVRRADGWLDAVDHYVARTSELPVSGICRMHYGGLLTAAGRWEQAEEELRSALRIYDATYRGTRFEALLRLADLHVRQGRLEEAERLLEGHERRADAAPALARLHLARGELQLAAVLAERHLDRRGRGLLSAPVLALLVEIELARGRTAEATRCARGLQEVADAAGHVPALGLAALSLARVAVAEGDGEEATARYAAAMEAFADAELPCELATAQLELAHLLARDQAEVARAEARSAMAGFRRLGSRQGADAAAALLRTLGDRGGRGTRPGAGRLTPRQTEVLALLAEGCSNDVIAERLFISPRTAEHHVSNILAELGLTRRAEATAYALRHGIGPGAPAPR